MTNMAISVVDSVMLLGGAQNSADVVALELLEQTSQPLQWQGQTLATAFVAPPVSGQTVAQRLLWLLEQLQQQSNAFNQQQVYLILPEQAAADDSSLNTFLQLLMQRMPTLLMAPGCRVFPYGSAGALMALNAAVQHIAQQPDARIWLLAVDSLALSSALDLLASAPAPDATVLSEGAIALCIASDCNGINIKWHGADASPGALPGQDSGIAALFLQLVQQVQQPLTRFYLPDCGDEQQSSRWQLQYTHLHGAIDQSSQLVFPSYRCGELGACGGLYRLWHLLSQLTTTCQPGLIAQLEISARQYRALTLFKYGLQSADVANLSTHKDV